MNDQQTKQGPATKFKRGSIEAAVFENHRDGKTWHNVSITRRYKNSSGYCAVVAEVEAVESVKVRKLTVVADVGLAINPDGVANQLEGGAIQAASWTLLERVRFDRSRVTSTSWEDYPILRFSEVPEVEVHVLPSTSRESLGVGEIVAGPVAGAIGNALAAALGVRVRDLPFTHDRVAEAIERDG